MLGKTEDKPHFEPNNRPNFGQKAMVKVLEIQGQETSLDIECEDREWSSKLAEALNEIISQILHNEESSIGTVELRIKNDTGKQQCISRFFCYIKESEHQCESIEEGMETSADFNLELAADILEKRGQLDGDSSFLDHYHHSLVPPSPKKHKYASARILAEEDSNNNRTNTTTSINENKNETPLQVSNDSQGTFPPGVITLVSLVILGLLLYGLVMFLKKRRKRSLNKKHLQIEKIKFIPRTKVPSDLEFGDSKSGLKLDIPKKASLSSRNNPSGLRIFSPKTADAMNNDANQNPPSLTTTYLLILIVQKAILVMNLLPAFDRLQRILDLILSFR